MIATIDQLVKLADACLQPLRQFDAYDNCSIDVLRLDKIHATISGNKWFKLRYSLQQAIAENKTTIVTAGGTYSNHILATACACSLLGLKSIGIIRGEEPPTLSCTLQEARAWGMIFEFVSRADFRDSKKLYRLLYGNDPKCFFVEEGGRNENGIKGAQEILQLIQPQDYDYICCAVGTGTMLSGLVRATNNKQYVIGVNCLKIDSPNNDFNSLIQQMTHQHQNYSLLYDYHFGGYARFTPGLLEFMNELYIRYAIPTDFVYTGKLLFAISDLVKKSYFRKNSRILVVHSGGLQGNCSLPAGALLF
jgi:1-aminocyclopropane-1-carboxylate deaminase/D-cysteine desulfhydrase-like pyridoxal-dependent ACC family enzyme